MKLSLIVFAGIVTVVNSRYLEQQEPVYEEPATPRLLLTYAEYQEILKNAQEAAANAYS
jgi:hypothetical protein